MQENQILYIKASDQKEMPYLGKQMI